MKYAIGYKLVENYNVKEKGFVEDIKALEQIITINSMGIKRYENMCDQFQ